MFSDSRLLTSDDNELDALFDTKGITKYRQNIKDFLTDTKYGTKDLSTFKQYLKDNNIAFSGFSKVVNAGKTAIKSFGASLASMAAMWAIMEVVSWAATAIDNYVNRVKYAKEALDDFSSSVKDQESSLSSNNQWIQQNGDRYAKLAKGVNEYGHNISLTSDEFSEYRNITKEIANMFPEMVSGYNDQNDAIIKNKGSVEALTKAYEDQKKAYYATIRGKSDETFSDFKTATEDDYKKITELRNMMKNGFRTPGYSSPAVGNAPSVWDVLDNDTVYALQEEQRQLKSEGKVGMYTDFSQLTPQLQQKIRDVFTNLNNIIDAESEKVRPILTAYLYSDTSGYDKLDDDAKNAVQSFIQNVDNTFFESFDSDIDMETWITENVINPLKDGINSEDLAVRIQTLFSLNKKDYDSYADYVKAVLDLINSLQNQTGKDGKKIYSKTQIDNLKTKFGVGDVDSEGNVSGNKLIEQTQKKYSQIKGANEYIKTLNEDELRYVNNVKGEVKTLEDLKNKVKSLNAKNQDTSDSKKKSFKQAWKDLDNVDSKSDMKNTKKDLLALAQAGKLTEKTFKRTKGTKTWLSQMGIDATTAVKKINKLIDASKQLATLKSSVKSLQTALNEKKENGVVGADTLSSMESEFSNLKSWDDYRNKLGSTTSTIEQCREAQNKLATEYINSNDFLSQLVDTNGKVKESTKQYYIEQLKELGVKNAIEVVEAQIKKQKLELLIADAKLDTSFKTEINNLINEGIQLGYNENAIKKYVLKKALANKNSLKTSDSIKNLKALAKQLGITGEAMLSFVTLEGLKKTYENITKSGNADTQHALPSLQKQISAEEKNLKKLIKKDVRITDADIGDAGKYGGVNIGNGKGSGSSSSSSNKVFDWIEVRLKRLENKVKKTVDNINDYASKKTKNGLFKQAKKQYDDLLHGYEIAAKKYKKKLDRINLSSDLKKKIQSGDYSIQTIKESAKKGKSKKSQKSVLDAIDSYQEYWDKYTGARDNIIETKNNKRELIKKQLEDDISDLEDDLDLLQYEADKTQSRIDKNETKGFIATKSDYKEEISNSKKQINKWNQEKKAYQAYLKDNKIASSSDEYQDIKQKIRDIDKNISDAEKNQLEWNKSISELPYQSLEKFKNILDAISSRYEKIISFWESQGHTKNESQITKQISIGLNGLSQLKKERDEKWSQINKTLSDKGLNSSQKKQFKALYEGMREGTITVDQFYKSISKLGISKKTFDSWDGLRDKLQEVDGLDGDILDKQAEIENNYDDLLTPWINSIQDLIDKINELNDAQSKAIELEKLQQALQSVKQNKKNLIYHEDYAFNYEADNSAVKEAQDNLDDYYNQEQLDTLNKILDWLNDHKDDVNFFDENGKPLYKTVDEAVRAVTKGMTEGMSDSVKKMFDSLTFSIDKNGKITASVPKYAAGTKYAKGGMSIVGEKGAELRLLNSGDQILPHDITDNLWKFGVNPTKMILDNIQIPDMSNLVKNTGDKMVNNNVSIGTVALPNINDLSKANDVFNALAGLSSYAHQQANKR